MSNNDFYMPKSVGEYETRLREMYAGLTAQSGGFTSLNMNGQSYTNATLAPVVLAFLNLFIAVHSTHTSWQQAVGARDAALEQILAFMNVFVKAVESQVPVNTAQVLESYGFRQRKEPPKQSVHEKAAKVDKSLATREKNHTLGKDQKKALDEGGSNVTQPGSGQKS